MHAGVDRLSVIPGFSDNSIDILSATIFTPVHWEILSASLVGYPDRDYVCNGFRLGFRIGIREGEVDLSSTDPAVAKPARLQSELRKKLNSELSAGHVLGPYDRPPLPDMQISPLYVVPKSEPGKFRMIHNLSHPKGHAVNDNLQPHMCTVSYCSVADVVDYMQHRPRPNYYLAKIDMKDAYRTVPIHPADWKYLGMKIEDKYFLDRVLPMGLSSSCAIYQRISDCLAWKFSGLTGCHIVNYLDDFLIVSDSLEVGESAVSRVVEWCEAIGFPISTEKTVLPAKSLVFLGIGINVEGRFLYIPENKRAEILNDVHLFQKGSSATVLEFQRLIGKLTFLCQIVLPGRSFLRSTVNQLKGILSSNAYARRRITTDMRTDLEVWSTFLQDSVGKPFKFMSTPDKPDCLMTSDASGSHGFGCYTDDSWFCDTWETSWWTEQNITLLELYPIYAGLQIWTDKFSNRIVLIRTDNEALVHVLSSLYSREPKVNHLLKLIALHLLRENIVIRPVHLRGVDNSWADQLSRGLPCPAIHNDLDMTRVNLPPAIDMAATALQLQ